jgi:hypothetical protein
LLLIRLYYVLFYLERHELKLFNPKATSQSFIQKT